MATQELDPITLQVISGALDTIAEEMGHILYRMSFSSIIRESQDLGAGLFDTDFNTLCESESTPLHIGSLPGYLRGIQDSLQGGTWNEGDVVIHNHPYFGASHSPDILIAIPIASGKADLFAVPDGIRVTGIVGLFVVAAVAYALYHVAVSRSRQA